MPVSLTARERAHLKGRAHALEPERALTAHGLIKVKINGTDRQARHAIAEAICTRTDAVAVHQVGKIIVLWRPTPEENPS